MKNFKVDHKNINFQVNFPPHLPKTGYLICKVSLKSLYASILHWKSSKIKKKLKKLDKTPHYEFIKGNKSAYESYLIKFGKKVGYGIEHSIENFNKLIMNNYLYLGRESSSEYIICQKRKKLLGSKNVIVDGVHRACLLINQGIESVPAAFIFKKSPGKFAQLDQYLKDYKDDILEWYTPIEIAGRRINERTYPDFKERPDFFNNKERGKSKWNFIIKKNLPNLKGKSVCDIGCNVGLYSIFMTQMGAKKVDGYDRGEKVIQPTNKNLPRQNVVQQAYFVKNLFKLAGYKNLDKINYFECDINKLDFSKLKYDLFFSSCVLYHFGAGKFEDIIKKISKNIPEVFLQTNLGHDGNLAKLASVSYQKKMLEKYGYKVKTCMPKGYNYPVLYGIK